MAIKWLCLFGLHEQVYIGQKHGMTMNKDYKGVIGSQRNMYACKHCEKSKKIEDKDYV